MSGMTSVSSRFNKEPGSIIRELIAEANRKDQKNTSGQSDVIIAIAQTLDYANPEEFNTLFQAPSGSFTFGRYSSWYDTDTQLVLDAMVEKTVDDLSANLQTIAADVEQHRDVLEAVCYFVEGPNGESLFQSVAYKDEICHVDYAPGKWEVELFLLHYKLMQQRDEDGTAPEIEEMEDVDA